MRPDPRTALALVLLGLAFAAGARASEVSDCDEAMRLLLAPELRSDQERASEAADLLSTERTRKLAGLSSAFVDFGLHVSVAVSPLKLLRSAREIGRGVRDWNDRSEAEDRALDLLEPGVRRGDLDAESVALYERLDRRESSERVEELLDRVEGALQRGDVRRARRVLDRALALEPGSPRADRLLDRIAELEWRATPDAESATVASAVHDQIEAWEVRLGTALLVGDYANAAALGLDGGDDAALGRATARYLGGDRAHALDEFRRIARGEDRAASGAQQFLSDPDVNPAGALDDEASRYRTQRALGWVGGPDLVEAAIPSPSDALSLTRDGYRAWQGSYRAWRKALRPVNLVIDAPARAWRSWQPDGRALHDAATRYLELAPDGDHAADATGWLDTLAVQDRASARVSPFQDGVLILPHARTSFSRLSSTRIVVARAALDAEASDLLETLGVGNAPALLLALDSEPGRATVAGSPLAASTSLDLLSRLASGIERATLSPRASSASGLLESLRRLDARVRAGRTLIAEPWTPAVGAGIDTVGSTLVDGGRTRTVGDVEVARHREAVVAERDLGGSGAFCPRETTCIDLRRDVNQALFARTDADGDAGIGARAGFDDAQLALEVGTSGPRLSLVIPVARWLGISRFFPVEARLAVGLDGVSAGPSLDEQATDPSL